MKTLAPLTLYLALCTCVCVRSSESALGGSCKGSESSLELTFQLPVASSHSTFESYLSTQGWPVTRAGIPIASKAFNSTAQSVFSFSPFLLFSLSSFLHQQWQQSFLHNLSLCPSNGCLQTAWKGISHPINDGRCSRVPHFIGNSGHETQDTGHFPLLPLSTGAPFYSIFTSEAFLIRSLSHSVTREREWKDLALGHFLSVGEKSRLASEKKGRKLHQRHPREKRKENREWVASHQRTKGRPDKKFFLSLSLSLSLSLATCR